MLFHKIFVPGGLGGDLGADAAPLIKAQDAGVHGHAALLGGHGHGPGDLGGLALPDLVAHRGGDHQQLAGRRAAGAQGGGQQLLAEHRLKGHGQLHPDLLLPVRREGVHDAVDGVHGGVGVQSAQDQMARLRRRHGGLDGLPVPHLPHQDDVRVLPQGRAQGAGKAGGVPPDLPLVENAPVRGVLILHRVLQCQHVGGPGVVDLVDHGGQGGGLAAARLAGDQDQALVQVGEFQHFGRQVQLL